MRGARVRMTIGTEHEYSINDAHFTALPVSDQILRAICGSYQSEILFGEVKLGKELQKTVLEFIPRVPASGPAALEAMLMQGIRKFYHIFPSQYHLLGLGMHPALTLDRTAVWDHDEGEYLRGLRPAFQYPAARLAQYPGAPDQPFVRRGKRPAHAVQPDPHPPPVPHRAHGVLAPRGGPPDGKHGQPAHLLPQEPGRDPADLQRHHPGADQVDRGVPGCAGADLLGAPGAGRRDPLRGMAQFKRTHYPVLAGAASRSRRRTNRSASAPIWRSLRW